MPRMLWTALAILALSSLALAGPSIDFTIANGTLSGHNAAMRLSGFASTTLGAKQLADMGSSNFSSRSLTNVNLKSSTISSSWFNSAKAGSTSLLVANTNKGFLPGTPARMVQGVDPAMCHNMVPEPGTLGLLGTGLVVLASALRLKTRW